MSKKDVRVQKVVTGAFTGLVFNGVIDAWLLMLALGGLADHLNAPNLAISYWSSLLIIVVSVCVLPQVGLINHALIQLIKSTPTQDNKGE